VVRQTQTAVIAYFQALPAPAVVEVAITATLRAKQDKQVALAAAAVVVKAAAAVLAARLHRRVKVTQAAMVQIKVVQQPLIGQLVVAVVQVRLERRR
jgi:hypothetical protein